MTAPDIDFRQNIVLFVDDEQKTRKYFSKLFGNTFRIVLAEDGVEGLERFREHQDEIGVVVTDQRMPNETGTEFLEKVALLKPAVVRILSTAYADIDAAVDSVNKAGIYRYITKPWEVPELEVTLKRAMELYVVRLEREELMRQKMLSVDILAAADRVISLAALAAFRNTGLRYVGEALKAVVRLSEGAGEREMPDSSATDGLSWRELYRRHLSFLGSLASTLPTDLMSGALDHNAKCNLRPTLEVVSGRSGGRLTWGEARATAPDWPGPPDALISIVGPFLDCMAEIGAEGGQVVLEECLSGLEVSFPGERFRRVLQPAVSSSAEEPSQLCLDLITSLIRLTHHGAVFDFLPDANKSLVRMRIGFDVSRVERAPGDPYEELAADLVGNELFWSRYVD